MNNTVPVTAQFVEQWLEHRVTDSSAVAGRLSDRYQAICGQVFIAAPLVAPPGPPCPDCLAALAIAPGAAPRQPPRHRNGLLRRLIGLKRAAAHSALRDQGRHR